MEILYQIVRAWLADVSKHWEKKQIVLSKYCNLFSKNAISDHVKILKLGFCTSMPTSVIYTHSARTSFFNGAPLRASRPWKYQKQLRYRCHHQGQFLLLFRSTLKLYLILDVATADVKRADRAATQPLQTQVSQSLTVTQVQMVKFTQPDKRQDTKTFFLKLFNWPNWGVCVWISPYTCVLSSLQIYQWCDYSDWHSALSVWHMMNLQSSTGSQHQSP